MRKKHAASFMLIVAVLIGALVVASLTSAQATSKSLSTVFAVQNLDAANAATVHVDYRTDTGAAWPNVSPGNVDFTVPAGGAVNIAQYLDTTMANGRGSATISSDRPIAAIVNQLARNQVPTSGSYSGFDSGAASVFAPLVFKALSTSAGLINSTLTVMNTGSAATDFNIVYIDGVTFAPVFTKTVTGLAPGVSYYADQSLETGLPATYYGSAVVNATTSGGTIAVVGNQFTGSNGLLTYSGFKSTDGYTGWAVPLYTCRLANGFSSPITAQNVSGSTIAANTITINFTPDTTILPGATPFNVTNPTAIPNNASFVYNPRVTTSCPTGSVGSARVSAPANVVVLVNQLQSPVTEAALSYNGIRTDGTNKTVLSPIVFSRLSTAIGVFSTVVTVQNLDIASSGTVTITYTPNSQCAGCATFTKVAPIAAGGGFIQNHRLAEGATTHPLPAGWFGSARIVSDRPIGAIVNQLELLLGGDNSLSFNTFSQP